MRPVEERSRGENGLVLRNGVLRDKDEMVVLEKWEGVKCWVLNERKGIEFWVESFRLELGFSDVVEAYPCCVGSGHEPNAVLFKVYVCVCVKVWIFL